MAAGLMRWLYGGAVQADSCGLAPAEDVDPLAAAVMAEIGVDLHEHQPKRLAELIAEGRFKVIVALSPDAWREVEPAAARLTALYWPTPDPTEGEGSREAKLEAYRMARCALETRIVERFGPPREPGRA
jgi:protein-tyrosine-phosphatase